MPKVIVQIGSPPGDRRVGADAPAFPAALDGLRDIARALDELGYWGLAHGGATDPELWTVFLGQHTRRLRHGPVGVAPGAHDPLRLAATIAVADHLLDGRLFVGLAGEADARDRDHLRVMKLAWAGEVVGRGGDDEDAVRGVRVEPRCRQDPHPPVFQPLTHGRATVQWAARQGLVPVAGSAPAEMARWFAQLYRDEAAEGGRDMGLGEHMGVVRAFSVHRSHAAAAEAVERYGLAAGTDGVAHEDHVIGGTVDEVRRRLAAERRDLAFEYLVWPVPYPLMPRDVVLEQLEVLATRVLPEIGMESPAAPPVPARRGRGVTPAR